MTDLRDRETVCAAYLFSQQSESYMMTTTLQLIDSQYVQDGFNVLGVFLVTLTCKIILLETSFCRWWHGSALGLLAAPF